MLIPFLISKIHRARVTGTNLDYAGSIGIDEEIMKKANLREYQKIEVYNISNGNRFSTYVIQEKPGKKEIILNGAAAHLVSEGDIIIVVAYAMIDERELNTLNSVILIMNEKNEISKIVNGKL
ncbi:MAG: aspartate 1-decarboxylase [Candidatus Aminicenantes bacterium]|nr:aspartate 1-decarboxylase [Candidatus Aminicenantes bacterium]